MNLTYKKALKVISSLNKFGSKPGLERIKKLIRLIGNPQDDLKFIHVAGTNGKGSVCFMLSAVLKECGYKTGLFISPSINDFRERIQINGRMIPQKKLAGLVDFFVPFIKNNEFLQDPITEFELTTAMAFKFFSDEKCDVVVLETGMGGKLDATNIIKRPIVSVITSISKDHVNVLGSTIEEIARQKLGIIKPKCTLVLAPNQKTSVRKTAERICALKQSKLIIANESLIQKPTFSLKEGISFVYENHIINVNLRGKYQIGNIATVLTAIKEINQNLTITIESVQKGLKKVSAPCRFEIAKINPTIILDSAHNPAGAKALSETLKEYVHTKNVIGIVGVFSDKDAESILKLTAPFLKKIFTVQPHSTRALPLEKITQKAVKYSNNVTPFSSIEKALKTAVNQAQKDGAIVIFGSFSIMKDAKSFLCRFDNDVL